MGNTYFTWDQYVANWRGQLVNIEELLNRTDQFPEYGLNMLDFTFKSDKKENLERLLYVLSETFNCTDLSIEYNSKTYELWGNTNQFPITRDNMVYWALCFYREGYNYDSELSGYGMYSGIENIEFLDYSERNAELFYKRAVAYFENENLFGAIVNWNNTVKIDSQDYHAYYDLGIAKRELKMFYDAIKDIDKSIAINPQYYSGVVARGTLSDESGEYDLAINYYDQAITIEPENPQAYFNKGNTHFNKKELGKACYYWNKAKDLGGEYAQERIDKECIK
jgi:tetratricopeptide (TPR) repeat protein